VLKKTQGINLNVGAWLLHKLFLEQIDEMMMVYFKEQKKVTTARILLIGLVFDSFLRSKRA